MRADASIDNSLGLRKKSVVVHGGHCSVLAAPTDDKLRKEISEIADMLQGTLDTVVQHGKRADSIFHFFSRRKQPPFQPGGDRDCVQTSGIPIFWQKWWLNTVGNAVSVHEIQSFEGGKVIGSQSYVEHFNKAGILFGGNLPWTTLGGPILAQNLSEDRKRQVLDHLLAQLPKRTSFIFVCSPDATDADLIKQSFKIAGFTLSKRVTYSRSPEDVEVLRLLKRKSRAHIKAADKNLAVVDISAEEFTNFYAENLRDAGVASYSPLHVARDLIAEGISRKQVRAICAKKKS